MEGIRWASAGDSLRQAESDGWPHDAMMRYGGAREIFSGACVLGCTWHGSRVACRDPTRRQTGREIIICRGCCCSWRSFETVTLLLPSIVSLLLVDTILPAPDNKTDYNT
jgi:hypothetical protein